MEAGSKSREGRVGNVLATDLAKEEGQLDVAASARAGLAPVEETRARGSSGSVSSAAG